MTHATTVLRMALQEAEAEYKSVELNTSSDIEAGRIAQEQLDEAQAVVDELTEALDRLERPEQFNYVPEAQEGDLVTAGGETRVLTGGEYVRPDVEEISVAGVGITRRRAE